MKNVDNAFSNIRVLLMEASSRAALPMARGFFDLGCEVTTVSGSKFAVGYNTRYAHNKFAIEGIDDNFDVAVKEYEKLFEGGHYNLIVPLSDFSANLASQNKTRWENRYNTKIAVNDWSVFQNIIDKSKTMWICEKNNIPAPKTLFSDDPLEEVKQNVIKYPIVVKPKTGVGSIGFNIVYNEKALEKLLESYDNANGPLLIQEYIEQNGEPQYGAEVFRDRDGAIRAALVAKVVRWYPIDGGSRLCSVSVHNKEIVDACVALVNALNWNGYANIDLVWDAKEKKAKILELNGRTGASVKLDFLAGIDICRLILENELGLPVSDMMSYEDNKMISCFLVDVLWFIQSKTRFTAKPSWFARWRIKDVIFSLDDPLPSVGFVVNSAKNFRKEMKKRKRIKDK